MNPYFWQRNSDKLTFGLIVVGVSSLIIWNQYFRQKDKASSLLPNTIDSHHHIHYDNDQKQEEQKQHDEENNDQTPTVTIQINAKYQVMYYQNNEDINAFIDHNHEYKDNFTINIRYSPSVTMGQVFTKILQKANLQQHPRVQTMSSIEKEGSFIKSMWNSFANTVAIEAYNPLQKQKLCSKLITQFGKTSIESIGLTVRMYNRFIHNPQHRDITCTHGSAKHCPIYSSMINNKEYTATNLIHCSQFTHFHNEHSEKSKCNQGYQCEPFIRLEKGGYKLDDRCHVKLYKHLPRTNRQIKNNQNFHAFVWKQHEREIKRPYEPTNDDSIKQGDTKRNGYVEMFIGEVIRNGFERDLCLTNDDLKDGKYTLLNIVSEKMKHIRHKQIGSPLRRDEMLALVLYTGCDCTYDLCETQRNGDYDKWKWFDYCLERAIQRLSEHERGTYKLYSGLQRVELDKTMVKEGYFTTYTSSSWDRNVAIGFMKGQGMLIEIDDKYRTEGHFARCCDVSWISKFPDECEVLFTRSREYGTNRFVLKIVDQEDRMQVVSLVAK